jgi:hypothetical protein
MAKDNSKKDESSSELEIIKSTLSSSLDESSVDIFSQDLFGPPKTPQPEKKPIEEPKPEPVKKTSEKKAEKKKPEPAPEPSLEEEKDVEELDLNIETGELKTVAAPKEEEKLEETEASLTQLEKMGGDLLSVAEIKKLFKNMNTMIDLLTLAMVRLDSLEKKLKDSKK